MCVFEGRRRNSRANIVSLLLAKEGHNIRTCLRSDGVLGRVSWQLLELFGRCTIPGPQDGPCMGAEDSSVRNLLRVSVRLWTSRPSSGFRLTRRPRPLCLSLGKVSNRSSQKLLSSVSRVLVPLQGRQCLLLSRISIPCGEASGLASLTALLLNEQCPTLTCIPFD